MGRSPYSVELCRELIARVRGFCLETPYRKTRYEPGDTLDLALTTAWPETSGRGRFRVEKRVGGGYAGQVYRCVLEDLQLEQPDAEPALRIDRRYAVKILVPPKHSAASFRDFVYWLAFQAPFSAQVNAAACRFGLLWPKLLRVAARDVFGDADAVADTYASFFDENFGAYGEVREWVEGRTWRLESDVELGQRRQWRRIDLAETESPEYVAKRRFMDRLVRMMREMGAAELARQYAWSTMKSQPNALKRYSGGQDPAAGLCAVDFRAGLALLPFLPMSPGDLRLIVDGLRRGSLAQFDRCDFDRLRQYVSERPDAFKGHEALVDKLAEYDAAYRRSMPDLSHQGWRLLYDRSLRRDVRRGLVGGYRASGTADPEFADRLDSNALLFTGYYLLGLIPFLWRFLRRLWGNRRFRRHTGRLLTSLAYLRENGRRSAAAAALEWHRDGRIGERHARRVADNVPLYWLERLTLGLLPVPALHRIAVEPGVVPRRIRGGWHYLRRFLADAQFREQWLREQVEDGYREGMLHEDERDAILARIKDPFIAKYLKSVGVHLATLPVTQIVSVLTGGAVAAYILAKGGSWEKATGAFVGILILFQFVPISPGSLCRGGYVVYLMIREHNFRDYMIAGPLAFLKYVGYLSFPLQMATSYPALSQFMAGRWATSAVHIVPVFGEKGALLEHMVFDLFFNVPRMWGRWASRHIKGILDLWLLLGTLGAAYILGFRGVDWTELAGVKVGVNVILTYIGVFLLPRVLFYPLLSKRRRGRNA